MAVVSHGESTKGKDMELGSSVVFKRDEYTNKVESCVLECRGMAMATTDGSYHFIGITPPAASLRDLEECIGRLLDQLNAARKEARAAFKL
jgi:hypothetical protein